MQHICPIDIFHIYMCHIWENSPSVYMSHICGIFRRIMPHICNVHAPYIGHICDIHAPYICIVHAFLMLYIWVNSVNRWNLIIWGTLHPGYRIGMLKIVIYPISSQVLDMERKKYCISNCNNDLLCVVFHWFSIFFPETFFLQNHVSQSVSPCWVCKCLCMHTCACACACVCVWGLKDVSGDVFSLFPMYVSWLCVSFCFMLAFVRALGCCLFLIGRAL